MKKTNESGRSMVEMLGVLAIVGVLSVGGLAGYTTAMNKYRQSELLNTISLTLVAAESEGNKVSYEDKYGTIPSAIKTIISDVEVDPSTREIDLKKPTGAGGIGCDVSKTEDGATTGSGPCKEALDAACKSGSFAGYTFKVANSEYCQNKGNYKAD